MNNIDIGFYISILKRRLPIVVAIAVTVLVASIVATRFMKPVYTASAKMLVEAPQIPTDLARSTVPLSATAQLLILQQQMTTYQALVELASKLDIYAGSKVKPSDDDIVGDLRSRIGFKQLEFDAQDPLQRVAVYQISFTGDNPALAAKVANELISIILSKNQRERTSRAGSTLKFFDQQVDALDANLKQLEDEILKFKVENKDTLPESLEFRRSEQGSLNDRIGALDREASELRRQRNDLLVTFTSTGQIPGGVQSPEQQMLVDLNRALADQLSIFSENSPNIIAIRDRIAQLQRTLVAARKDDDSVETAAKDGKPQFGLDLQLSEIDKRLAAIATEKASAAERIDVLAKSIAATPASETMLNAFERNRENVQKQYNAAIAQRAEASTGEQLEIRADGERFSMLEPAMIPNKAAGPKRRVIVGAGAAAGLGLGLALVVLMELLNKTVRRPQDIAKLLQVEPLATIPIIYPAKARGKSRWRPALVAAATVVLFLVLPAITIGDQDYSFESILLSLATVFTGTGAT